MLKRKLVKAVQSLLRTVGRLSKRSATRATRSLMRTLMRRSRRANLPAGFVLPTVTMVMLVVVLLTLAVTMRTFDRAQNARNFQVDQATLQASTPAIERARAKIDQLMNSFSATPSDIQIDNALKSPIYKFGDETALAVAYDINNDNKLTLSPSTSADITQDEVSKTAWSFPVDTDNDGKFDSYTLYNILFRSPSRATTGNNTGQFNRARIPLESRTPPMPPGGNISDFCAAAVGNAAAMAGDSDWFRLNGKLQKSIFVYVATVPLSDADILGKDPTKYTKGKNSFSSLEYEQDRARIALSNNAVWFDDDVELTGVSNINLNGRLFTNSNFLVSTTYTGSKGIQFLQVSDPRSCFYTKENSKIVVAGNVANGGVVADSKDNTGNVQIHRFNGANLSPTGQTSADGITSTNKTTTESDGTTVGYNTKAYNQRLGTLVTAALWLHDGAPPTPVGNYPNNVPVTKTSVSAVAKYPKELSDAFALQFDTNPGADPRELLKGQLENYFKERMRRVPFKEIAVGASEADAVAPLPSPLTSSNYQSVFTSDFRPPDDWMRVVQPGTDTPITNLPTLQYLKAQNQDPKDPSQVSTAPEALIGDRVLVGNGLPSRWLKDDGTVAPKGTIQPVPNKYWQTSGGTDDTSTKRFRQSFVDTLPDLGNTGRGGFWETQAAKAPKPYENSGGLRVVTGAGIYYRPLSTEAKIKADSFLPKPVTGDDTVVWPDTMPMTGGLDDPTTTGVNESTAPPHLRMRATVVYHYANNASTTTAPIQKPIACISSYYDPTNAETARNQDGLPDVSGVIDANADGVINASDKLADGTDWTARPTGAPNARSNNGVVYSASSINQSISAELTEQAKLRFPDGRLVNKPLADAIANANAGTLTNAGASAIHAAQCAIGILNGTLTVDNSIIPHGAIKEGSFLDGREVKTLHRRSTTTPSTAVQWLNWLRIGEVGDLRSNTVNDTYTLPLEQRQPSEIRVTELDLNLLRKKAITNTINAGVDEYLLPNSGVIYATRDDALPDVSSSTSDIDAPSQKDLLVSSSDFKLDPSRRPNGIRLINGASLVRGGDDNKYRDVERGLVLATNLPVYIRSQKLSGGLEGFNLHKNPDPSSTTLIEEFTNQLITGVSFYSRSTSDSNPGFDKTFACRKEQRGCSGSGDQWRPATIIADTISLQSSPTATSGNVLGFWDGFRNNSDYDLNNNRDIDSTFSSPTPIEKRIQNGFLYNNFVTSADWAASSDGYPRKLTASTSDTTNKNFMTSYLVNGVTPVQRRVGNNTTQYPEYVMEICRKIPVSECGPQDWVVGYNIDGNTSLNDPVLNFDVDGNGIVNTSATPPLASPNDIEANIKLHQLPQAIKLVTPTPDTKILATKLGSGTTAKPALVKEDQRYARRVAFLRDAYGNLQLPSDSSLYSEWPKVVSLTKNQCKARADDNTNNADNRECDAIPLAVDNSGNVNPYPYITGTTVPAPATGKNTLWFWTTNDNSEASPSNYRNSAAPYYPLTPPKEAYGNQNLPFYYDPLWYYSWEKEKHERILPDINLPASLSTVTTAMNGTPVAANVAPDYDDPADFTICIPGGIASQDYALVPGSSLSGSCPLTSSTISTIRTTLFGLPKETTAPSWTGNVPLVLDAINTESTNANRIVDTDNNGVLVYELPATIAKTGITNADIVTITLIGKSDSIFVLKGASASDITFGAAGQAGVRLQLQGVNPNNVFWVSAQGMVFNDAYKSGPDLHHQLSGNFIGGSGLLTIATNTQIRGGRFLGFNGITSTTIPTDTTITAITTTEQPLLVPMLSIHSPTGTPNATDTTIAFGPTGRPADQSLHAQWLMKASSGISGSGTYANSTIFNATFVSKNSPSRPTPGETGGGLANFVRLQEQWGGGISRSLYISGNFIQTGQSNYATGPAQSAEPSVSASGLFLSLTGNKAPYRWDDNDQGFLYRGGGFLGRSPFYFPATRNWGFDVGILSQMPDLFGQRFTGKAVAASVEYFRGMNRDDTWVKNLLCAAAADAQGNYTQKALASRPTTVEQNCPALPYPN